MDRIKQLTERFGRSFKPGFLAGASAVLAAANFAFPAAAQTAANQNFHEPPLITQPSSGVRLVKKQGQPQKSAICEAGPNDYIYLEVVNYSDWLSSQDPNKQKQPLVLYLGGEALPTLQPKFFDQEWTEPVPDPASNGYRTNRVSSFGVRLEQNAANRAAWKRLSRNLGFNLERPMEVSLGFEDGPAMHSWVYPQPEVEKSPFFLVMLSKGKLSLGVFVIVGAFFLFVQLARRTDILRDPNLPLRPDESKPFSLARAQMAFWFFLVMGSYFFLWLLSGDTDTLNASTVTLIGISAGTAVSSAFIDAGKRSVGDFYEKVVPKTDLQKRREDLLAELKSDLHKTEDQILAGRNRAAVPDNEDESSAADDRRKSELTQKKRLLEQQIEFFSSPRWRAAMLDLLGENGVTSFHRFQMCVWTIVLGIVFISEVYTKMAMPEFSGTLLGLMGVSAGTFIGFKIPDQSKA